jgi:FMN phosphatase YigB (HAD superfamily)
MPKLISFDIDGTLETGDPPGYITIARVREALELGYIIGSCSDRTVSQQQRMWEEHGIPVSFTVLKHRLDQVKAEFSADAYFHIGDTNIDRHYAERNGFVYFFPDTSIDHLWIAR